MRTLPSRPNPGALGVSQSHWVFAGLASRRRATHRRDPRSACLRPRGAPGGRGGGFFFGGCPGGPPGAGGRGRWLRGSGGGPSGRWGWGRCPPWRARPSRRARRSRQSGWARRRPGDRVRWPARGRSRGAPGRCGTGRWSRAGDAGRAGRGGWAGDRGPERPNGSFARRSGSGRTRRAREVEREVSLLLDLTEAPAAGRENGGRGLVG
jgi:hypothetical protein